MGFAWPDLVPITVTHFTRADSLAGSPGRLRLALSAHHLLLSPRQSVSGGVRRFFIEHGADVIVSGNVGHAEQRVAIGAAMAVLQRTLVREEGFALHEKRREGRQPDIGHRILRNAARALVRKPRAAGAQTRYQSGENHHPHLESDFRARGNPLDAGI